MLISDWSAYQKLGKDMLSVARKSVDHGELPKEGEDGWEKNSGESLLMTHNSSVIMFDDAYLLSHKL